MGLKTKDPAFFCFGKKLEKCFCTLGILAAKLGPMEEKNEFMILGISSALCDSLPPFPGHLRAVFHYHLSFCYLLED